MISLSLVRLCNLKMGVGHHASVQAVKDLFEFQSWRDFFFFKLGSAFWSTQPQVLQGNPIGNQAGQCDSEHILHWVSYFL